MTLAFATTPLLGLVDTGVIGRTGDAALMGGLALGAILFDLVFTSFNFMRASTTGLVAQAMGRGDAVGERAVVLRALMFALGAGLLLALLSGPLLHLGLLVARPSERVAEAVSDYFSIRILAAPLTLWNYAVLGWLLGLARSGMGLALQVVLNGTNIALSLWLGLYLGWAIEGVAWATVAAEGVAALLGLGLLLHGLRGQEWPSVSRLLNGPAWQRLVALNADIMVRSFCLIAAFFSFTALGNRFGETTLAANAVLMNFFLLAGFLLDGLATASEQMAGRAVGAAWRIGFDRSVRLTVLWGFVVAGVLSLLFLLAGSALIDLLAVDMGVRETARTFLPYAAATALVGCLAFMMDGVFIGATWSRDMRNMMLVSIVAYVVALVALLPSIGNHGLWIALLVFLGLRGATLWARLATRRDQTFAPAIMSSTLVSRSRQ